MEDNNKPWFTNKDLYILITELSEDMNETRHMIRKYNGLYTKLSDVKQDTDNTKADVESVKQDVNDIKINIGKIEATSHGRKSVGEGIKTWGGWIVSIIMMLIALSQFL